jgi:sulfite reductase (ferredoxin)
MPERIRSDVEDIKEESQFLAGTIAAELAQSAPDFAPPTSQVLKFHGIYQQDDRDLRGGPDGRSWIFMVRAAVPGGRLSADQYLAMDGLADEIGDGKLRITSRQGIQWHHAHKSGLRSLIRALNDRLVTTLGACGDVVRNTMHCPAPLVGREPVGRYVDRLAHHFRPRTRSYYEIWLNGEKAITAQAPTDPEPVYGATYLPRKFKIAFAHPADNCTDVYSNDVGIVPQFDGEGIIDGFDLLVGGGMGRSHNQPDTFPRIADPFAHVSPDHLLEVVEAIVTIQRDFGERLDRKHARLKYLVEYWGIDDFRAAVERLLERRLAPPRWLQWDAAADHLGWQRAVGGDWFLGLPVENGRITDSDGSGLRTGLREIVGQFGFSVRLTPSQNLLLVGIPERQRIRVEEVLEAHGILQSEQVPPVIRSAMACVALPTCGLALTDAERSLPRVIRQLEATLASLGLPAEQVVVRMTGCPNGCARPYNSEIGLVGRRTGRYDIHLGADPLGLRLNTLVAEAVPEKDIATNLQPLLLAWRDHRLPGEAFGDFTHRMGVERVRKLLAEGRP